MKVNLLLNPRRNERGSAFLFAMLVVIVVLPLAVSYMLASQQQYRLVDRSQVWNTALPTAEAGIEEGFAHLNRDCYSNAVNNGSMAWTNGGWTYASWSFTNTNGTVKLTGTAKGLRSPKRYLGSNYYEVTIVTNSSLDTSISETKPEIVSVGYSPSIMRIGGSNYGSRQVRVKTQIFFFNSYGVESLGDIESKGRGITLDAYDPTKTWGGLFNSTNIIYSGDMASISGNITFSGQGTVDGSVNTSPYGTLSTNSNTTVTGGYNNTVNSELLDPPFDTTAASSWPSLTTCASGCSYSYTNVTSHPVTMTTDVYPGPQPGGVTTNTDGAVTTAVWPSNYTGGTIRTSIVVTTTAIYPNPVPSGIIGSIYTNSAPQWFTNFASGTSSSPSGPPTYPTNYSASTGVITDSLSVSNFLVSAPANNCCIYTNFPTGNSGYWDYVYKNSNGTNTPDFKNVSGNKYYAYQYVWIKDYRYQIAGSYSYTNYVYSYTNLTYSYMGTNESSQVITDNYKYIAKPSGNYYMPGDLTLSSENMLIEGNVVIYVAGNVNITGNSKIIIPDGSSLTFYFGGNVKMSGNGGIDNQNERAQSLTMWGLPTCTTVDISGNAGFVGTLYAPEAAVTLKGSGNSNFDIRGSISGATVTVDGKFQIDYPLDLRISGPMGGFVASQWLEEAVGNGPK